MLENPALRSATDARVTRVAPLVEVLRGGQVESVHHGHVAVVDADGRILAWAGDPRTPVFPRSSFKPFQALPLVESGAFARTGLGPSALALIAGSHGGTDAQAALALAVLERAGVDERALRCGAHAPYDERTAAALRERRQEPGPLRHNCSGKHAGMLLYARELGAPLRTYIEPGHPVQRRIFERFSEVTGEPWLDSTPGIDGCSAPTPRMPLSSLARAFALLALGRDSAGRGAPGLAAIRDAMMVHPEHVASEGRLDTLLMRTLRGRGVSKAGAEGMHAVGLADRGVGIAIKIADGSRRALGPAAVGVLTRLGLLTASEREALAHQAETRLSNYAGFEVGAIRAMLTLEGDGL
jgi:L-asparaginase II